MFASRTVHVLAFGAAKGKCRRRHFKFQSVGRDDKSRVFLFFFFLKFAAAQLLLHFLRSFYAGVCNICIIITVMQISKVGNGNKGAQKGRSLLERLSEACMARVLCIFRECEHKAEFLRSARSFVARVAGKLTSRCVCNILSRGYHQSRMPFETLIWIHILSVLVINTTVFKHSRDSGR